MTDPLQVSIPIQDTDTSFPLIPEADYELSIVDSKIEANYDKIGLHWSLVYGLTQPVEAMNGKTVNVGTKFFPDWPLQLQPREDGKGGSVWQGSAAERSLVSTVDAIFGTSLEAKDRPVFNQELVSQAMGRRVIGHITIDTDKNGVQRNKVTRLKKAA